MFTETLLRQATDLLKACERKGLTLAIAESCTGGLLAALFTEIPGSSSVFECGFVTYSNTSKQNMLGVRPSTIAEHGAVSEQVAVEMARGALERARVDIAAAITGIAGPGGGSTQKPVGLVYIAVVTADNTVVLANHFKDGRGEIRQAAAAKALNMIEEALSGSFTYTA